MPPPTRRNNHAVFGVFGGGIEVSLPPPKVLDEVEREGPNIIISKAQKIIIEHVLENVIDLAGGKKRIPAIEIGAEILGGYAGSGEEEAIWVLKQQEAALRLAALQAKIMGLFGGGSGNIAWVFVHADP